MGIKSNIEWTDATWNPITGCSKYSDGCFNCYAEIMAKRLQAMGQNKYSHGFDIIFHEDVLNEPLKWKKSKKIFVCSMSDLFHEDLEFSVIDRVFSVMQKAEHHIFQILTKRAEHLAGYASRIGWPRNVWAGVTVESNKHLDRIEFLKTIKAPVRFISFEPLLSVISPLDLNGIDWVIVGGESGISPRKMEESWVKGIRDNCLQYKVPFFFKQWGGKDKKTAGSLLAGKEWKEFPKL